MATSGVAGAVTLTAGGDGTSTTYAGVIQDGSGTVALTKAGAGTFTLTGADTYTGTTTINAAGTLQIGSGGATGSIASANVVDNGTLAFHRSNAGGFNGRI